MQAPQIYQSLTVIGKDHGRLDQTTAGHCNSTCLPPHALLSVSNEVDIGSRQENASRKRLGPRFWFRQSQKSSGQRRHGTDRWRM